MPRMTVVLGAKKYVVEEWSFDIPEGTNPEVVFQQLHDNVNDLWYEYEADFTHSEDIEEIYEEVIEWRIDADDHRTT